MTPAAPPPRSRSLRTRLAAVLAALMAGPLIAAWIAVGVVAPAAAAREATAALRRSVSAADVALAERCLGIGDAAASIAGRLSSSISISGRLDAGAARAAVEAAVARRPDSQAAVVVDGRILASAGTSGTSGTSGDLAGVIDPVDGVAASCSRRTGPLPQGSQAGTPALVESVSVRDGAGPAATAIVVQPLEDGALATLRAQLGLTSQLVLMHQTTVLSASGDRAPLAPVLAAVAAGRTSGEVAGMRYLLDGAPTGVPYGVLAVSPIRSDALSRGIALGVLAATAAAVLLVGIIATRLTRPLTRLTETAQRLGSGDLAARSGLRGHDEVATLAAAFDLMAAELQTKLAQLQRSRDELADSFARFGEALARTHDLDGLLRTVLEAARADSDAVVAAALLWNGESLSEQQASVAPDADPSVTGALDALAGLGAQALSSGQEVVAPSVPAAGPALAVPLVGNGSALGVLVLARAAGAQPFDDAARAAVQALATQAGTAFGNLREHEETRRLSVTDPLTGVGNFRHLTTTLKTEVERASRFARPLSVLMLDLDHFKQVNDTEGHAFGDAVLREFASRLSGCVREVDTVARYGGEEFTVVLPETDAVGAATVAGRILEAVRAEEFESGGRTLAVTVSVGVASFPDHGRTFPELMRSADSALYLAKSQGRNRCCVAGAPGGNAAVGAPR